MPAWGPAPPVAEVALELEPAPALELEPELAETALELQQEPAVAVLELAEAGAVGAAEQFIARITKLS
jgi:hypothetical protein